MFNPAFFGGVDTLLALNTDIGSDTPGGGEGPVRNSGRTDPSEALETGALIRAMWRYRALVAAATGLVALIFFMIVNGMTPHYTSRASLMLDPRSVRVLTSDDVVSDLSLTSPVIDTEAAVLRSNLVLEDVAKALGTDALRPIDPAFQRPDTLDRIRGVVRWILPRPAPGPRPAGDSPEAAELRRMIHALRTATSVRREGQSYLITIIAETPDPALSQSIADSVVAAYIARQIAQRNEAITGATAFLETRANEAAAEVEAAEQAIAEFRTSQIAALGLSEATLDRQLAELTTQLALAQADHAQAEARLEQVETVLQAEGLARAAELLSSPYVVTLRQQISETRRRAADLATRVGDSHPDRVAAAADLDQLTGDLASEVQRILTNLGNDAAVAQSRVDTIRASVDGVEADVTALSRANVELRQLERQAEALRANYQDMLNRLSETRSSEELQRADARQVERALLPDAPSSPRIALVTTFGGAIGFGLGLIAAFLLAVSRSGYKTPEAMEADLGLPVLASLLRTRLKDRATLIEVLNTAPYSPFVERLRQLRTFLTPEGQAGTGRCLMVTSSVDGESKTTTTLALAFLEARAGRRCLIIDFDLRRSNLSRELRYLAEHDLGDVLSGTASPDEAIASIEELGVDLLTLKRPAPYLGDQTDQSTLQAMLTDLAGRYDLILVDTAPVLLVADGLKIAPLMDGVLFLVRHSSTKPAAVRQAVRRLQNVGAPNIGLAMTMTDPASERDSYGTYGDYADEAKG